MSTAEILRELPKLKPAERRMVRAKLNELDGVADDPWLNGELTDQEKAMLEARLVEYEKNPEAGSSWEKVEARLRMQLRERAGGSLFALKPKLTSQKSSGGTKKSRLAWDGSLPKKPVRLWNAHSAIRGHTD